MILHSGVKSLRYEFISNPIADRARKRQMHPRVRALRPRERCIADASGYSAGETRKRTEGTGEPSVSMGAPWYAPVRFSTVNGGPRRGGT